MAKLTPKEQRTAFIRLLSLLVFLVLNFASFIAFRDEYLTLEIFASPALSVAPTQSSTPTPDVAISMAQTQSARSDAIETQVALSTEISAFAGATETAINATAQMDATATSLVLMAQTALAEQTQTVEAALQAEATNVQQATLLAQTEVAQQANFELTQALLPTETPTASLTPTPSPMPTATVTPTVVEPIACVATLVDPAGQVLLWRLPRLPFPTENLRQSGLQVEVRGIAEDPAWAWVTSDGQSGWVLTNQLAGLENCPLEGPIRIADAWLISDFPDTTYQVLFNDEFNVQNSQWSSQPEAPLRIGIINDESALQANFSEDAIFSTAYRLENPNLNVAMPQLQFMMAFTLIPNVSDGYVGVQIGEASSLYEMRFYRQYAEQPCMLVLMQIKSESDVVALAQAPSGLTDCASVNENHVPINLRIGVEDGIMSVYINGEVAPRLQHQYANDGSAGSVTIAGITHLQVRLALLYLALLGGS